MEHTDAVAMIEGGMPEGTVPQHWADLGCGTGTFTKALAELLPKGSRIEAVDRDAKALASLPKGWNGVDLRTHAADMRAPLPWTGLDGVLLANALHYVADQAAFLQQLAPHLQTGGTLLFVEYEQQPPNPWVPYPIGFRALARLFPGRSVVKFGERPSAFGRAVLYAARVR